MRDGQLLIIGDIGDKIADVSAGQFSYLLDPMVIDGCGRLRVCHTRLPIDMPISAFLAYLLLQPEVVLAAVFGTPGLGKGCT